MADSVSIVNMALAAIGAQSTVTSINPSDGSVAGNIASLIYQQTIDSLSRSAHWNCLRRQATLTVLKAAAGTPENPTGTGPTPQVPWLYAYAYPSDCIKARFILPFVPTTAMNPPLTTGAPPIIPYHLPVGQIPYVVGVDIDASGNEVRVINTNLSQAQLVYTARVKNPGLWDPHFTQAAIAYLATFFVPALSLNMPLMNAQAAMTREIVAAARVSDGNEGVAQQDHEPDWLRVRGRLSGVFGGAHYFASWDSIAFPGGGSF